MICVSYVLDLMIYQLNIYIALLLRTLYGVIAHCIGMFVANSYLHLAYQQSYASSPSLSHSTLLTCCSQSWIPTHCNSF